MIRTSLPLNAFLMATLTASPACAQPEPVRDAAALQVLLDKLQVLGTVLYVAAHPDDENTAALAAFSQGAKVRAAYLSMTRGGGGQNLIGPELGDGLALIRTQELLAARHLDGAEQYFTRCNDFGFSKTPEETLSVWGHDAALADVVWIVRKLRPDVILTRFSPTIGTTHGHHTASAMLALEAFRAAADPKAFPEQLDRVRPWQARRILWNSFRPQAERDAMKPGSFLTLDVGAYDPVLGKSFTELAAESRSMHRSQGFGAVPSRGSRLEYFEPLAGEPAKAGFFEGVDLTWGRVVGGEEVRGLLARARAAYRPERPSETLGLLLKAKAALEKVPADPWVEVKRGELVEAIRCAAGLWAEAIAGRPGASPGEEVPVTATLVARGSGDVTVKGLQLDGTSVALDRKLAPNEPLAETRSLRIPAGMPPSRPAWLGAGAAPPSPLAGLPEGPAAFQATFRLEAGGVPFDLRVPVQYRFRDPVLGERYQAFTVAPPVLVNLADPVQILPDAAPRSVTLDVAAGRGPVSGVVRLLPPAGWKADPAEIPFALDRAGDERKVVTTLTPPSSPGSGSLEVAVAVEGPAQPALSRVRIDYPHIPIQTYFPAARARLVRLDLKRGGSRIGYVMGSGDEIPRTLRPLGYQVDLLSDEDLAGGALDAYDAIVVGIRAFNTRPRLAQLKGRLLDYVARGGTEVVLYAVDQGLVTPDFGPYPFKVSRDRVTEETAPVTFLAPASPVLNWPNRITAADFEGWVQERGLYYARDWDPRYQAVLASGDAGEKPLAGGLIVANHGKGHFVYTGLAFFRQLPDGVPGAYRLFANLLALKTAP
ncbi:PIG-L family deacetylase [Geothrix sp. 21YS21S-2]|uniref:PIG-L family deacetylase n=1 Tax=Geothrix sp. 21YS21S-2 TaxID=3068893 RepID=UPI0027B93D0B|nr:PIG-L family deacetylase [Geothrix sp. 21YS21S-2]